MKNQSQNQNKNQGHQTGIMLGLLAALAALFEGGEKYREIRQKKLQKEVDDTSPSPKVRDLTVDFENIKFEKIDYENFDLNTCQEILMNKEEIDMWKSFISNCVGGGAQIGMDVSAVKGLLKCDVPLNELFKIKDNPGAMRGFVRENGRFTKQATFTEAGLGSVAPLMIYQCMAFVTSQYYQQIITERLEEINGKLDKIIQHFSADDRAILKIAYKRFVELQKKNTYDIADKVEALKFLYWAQLIGERNRYFLFAIKDLNIEYAITDKKEAERKIQKLQSSRYFEYLDLTIQAEVMTFIAYAVLIKIAKYLGNDEDVKIYMDNLNVNFWDKYDSQFSKLKHDVIKYLELESESSMISKKSITAMKNAQLKEFNNIKTDMLNRQELLNRTIVQYIEVKEDGTIRKYMPIDTRA